MYADTTLFEGHPYEYYLDLYKRAIKTRKIGRILTGVGIAVCLTGALSFMVGYSSAWGGDDRAGSYAWTGALMFVGGFVSLNIGIPMSITGSIKRNNNRKAMDAGWPERKYEWMKYSLGPTSNGIGLTIKI